MSNEHETSYCAAYWGYLRCETILEPRAEAFALTDEMAIALRAQCQIEYQQQLIKKAKGKV